jgi:dihydrodipicolinate synthase/N-acetylneuraminate lyase
MSLRGTLAAAVTPLRDGGDALDVDVIDALADLYAGAGLDGVLALGTTGEGILLDLDERRRAAERWIEVARGRLDVAVHCGAQSTRDTAALAEHAAATGAAAIAVISPPYYPLDDAELFEHLAAAAAACAPTPFFVYEFAARSGYPVPPALIQRLRERAPNLAGLKVSDTPFDRFEPYLIEGLDILTGPEAFIHRSLALGSVGAVSGLAAAFPEQVAEVVRDPSEEGAERIGRLRATVQRFPFQAALKTILADRGVPIGTDVRRPLRGLEAGEREELLAAVAELAPA